MNPDSPTYSYGSPVLDKDGVTILLPFRGRTTSGVFYQGTLRVPPDDERYRELLPHVAADPQPDRTQPPSDSDDRVDGLLRRWGIDPE